MKPLFDMVSEMNELEELELCFQRGEELFAPEHKRYEKISEKLKAQGYTVEQVEKFKQHYKNEIARVRDKEKAVSKEERIAKLDGIGMRWRKKKTEKWRKADCLYCRAVFFYPLEGGSRCRKGKK